MNKLLLTLTICLCACANKPCEPLPNQWEQTRYKVDATARTDSGVALDGSLDPVQVDEIADWVDDCLSRLGPPTKEAQCAQHQPWKIDRSCTTIKTVPGVRSCTLPELWVLPDDAGDSCATWGKSTTAPDGTDCSHAPCHFAVATQDGGRTIVIPTQDPTTRLAEGFVRVATSCLYPWLDPG